MPHPIYGPPSHSLEQVTLTLTLPSRRNGHVTLLEMQGRSSTSRAALWTFRESWLPGEVRVALEPTDTVHWLVLAALQDQPNTQEAFVRSTTPGGWEDVPLPF